MSIRESVPNTDCSCKIEQLPLVALGGQMGVEVVLVRFHLAANTTPRNAGSLVNEELVRCRRDVVVVLEWVRIPNLAVDTLERRGVGRRGGTVAPLQIRAWGRRWGTACGGRRATSAAATSAVTVNASFDWKIPVQAFPDRLQQVGGAVRRFGDNVPRGEKRTRRGRSRAARDDTGLLVTSRNTRLDPVLGSVVDRRLCS